MANVTAFSQRPAVSGAASMVGAVLCFAAINALVQAATMQQGMKGPETAFWQYLIAAALYLP